MNFKDIIRGFKNGKLYKHFGVSWCDEDLFLVLVLRLYIRFNIYQVQEVYTHLLLYINYPTTKMMGCWFHFTIVLLRKKLKNHKNSEQVFNKFHCLPLLKHIYMTEAYQMLKIEAIDRRVVK